MLGWWLLGSPARVPLPLVYPPSSVLVLPLGTRRTPHAQPNKLGRGVAQPRPGGGGRGQGVDHREVVRVDSLHRSFVRLIFDHPDIIDHIQSINRDQSSSSGRHIRTSFPRVDHPGSPFLSLSLSLSGSGLSFDPTYRYTSYPTRSTTLLSLLCPFQTNPPPPWLFSSNASPHHFYNPRGKLGQPSSIQPQSSRNLANLGI